MARGGPSRPRAYCGRQMKSTLTLRSMAWGGHPQSTLPLRLMARGGPSHSRAYCGRQCSPLMAWGGPSQSVLTLQSMALGGPSQSALTLQSVGRT